MTCNSQGRGSALLLVGMMCLILGTPSGADDVSVEERGFQIALEARERNEGFASFEANLTMVLRNRQGEETNRQLRLKILEVLDEGDKTLFIFDEPRDVRGTAFLIHTSRDASDDIWLFLPSLERVKRISSSNRSGSFMGSEFAYEDLTDEVIEKFSYRYIGDEPCGDLVCTIIERVPLEADSGYSRQVMWHDTEESRLWKVEFYDRRGELLKTLTVSDYDLYLERFWYAGQQSMVNHRTGKSTLMLWQDMQLGRELDERDFTRTGLKRLR